MEYVLLIEGIGWLVDENAGLSAGIEGDVFCTADLAGTLAADLSTTGHTNLLSSNVANATDTSTTTDGFTAIDSAAIMSASLENGGWKGKRCLGVSPVNTVNGTLGGVKTDATAVVLPSTTYVASFYVTHFRSAASYSINAYLKDEVNAIAGTTVTTTLAAYTPPYVWTRVSCTVTTGAGSPTLSLYITENAESTSQRHFYIDGLQIEEGSTASSWFNGTLRVGTCAVHKGLQLPTSVSDKMDALNYQYDVGGLNFTITDYDGFVQANITPDRTPTESTLDQALVVTGDDIVLSTDTGNSFVEGDEVWIGGRELVKLGAKSGAGPYTFTDSIRGYLGTPKGKCIVGFPGSTAGFEWSADTVVQSVNRFLWDKRVRLYAHVPGEAADDMLLLYAGKLKSMTSDCGGASWEFESAGEQANVANRIRSTVSGWSLIQTGYIRTVDGTAITNTALDDGFNQDIAALMQIAAKLYPGVSGTASSGGLSKSNPNRYVPLSVYQYRTEPGGTAGAKASIFTTTPQAETFNSDLYAANSYLQVDGKLMRVIKKQPSLTGLSRTGLQIACDTKNLFGDWWLKKLDTPMQVKFLLDNLTDEYKMSRFAVNRMVHRNPITVLLMFLTSMHDESLLANGIATGSTTTKIVFPDNVLGEPRDRWRGYALHSVEGTSNKGYAREILGNSTGTGNYINVARGFPSAPTGTTEEFQIRNSIYDVLPLGWGLGVHHSKIDIDQFEYVRDTFLADARLGKFIIGMNDQTDMLDVLLKNICQAYSVLIFVGRDGRLTCEYMGEALGDGIITDYVTVQKRDIIGDVGDLQYHIEMPIGSVQVKVRNASTVVVDVPWDLSTTSNNYGPQKPVSAQVQDSSLEGSTFTFDVRSTELVAAYGEGTIESISVDALLNSIEDCEHVLTLANQKLRKYVHAPPTFSFRVGLNLLEDIHAGSYLSVTHDSLLDPYTAQNGLSSRVCRVLSTEIMLSETDPGVNLEVEILDAVAGALIAPACEVLSKSSDSNGQYLNCSTTAYTADPDNTWDHMRFKLNDRVELRSFTGALKEDLGTITGFGDNFDDKSDEATFAAMPPTSVKIYVSDGSITSTIATGDYITFSSWSGSNTTNMNSHAAYADADGALTGGSTAKEYG